MVTEWLKDVFGKQDLEFSFKWGDDMGLDGWLSEFENRMIDANANAVNKGFWDDNRPDTDAFSLIVRELTEALEYNRDGNPPSDKIPDFDGESEELGDAIIRIWDTCEMREYDLIGGMEAIIDKNGEGVVVDGDWADGFGQLSKAFSYSDMIGDSTSFASDIGEAIVLLSETWKAYLDVHTPEQMGELYATVVCFIMAMGAKHGLRIAEAIDAKMEYNKNRPYKHGKAF